MTAFFEPVVFFLAGAFLAAGFFVFETLAFFAIFFFTAGFDFLGAACFFTTLVSFLPAVFFAGAFFTFFFLLVSETTFGWMPKISSHFAWIESAPAPFNSSLTIFHLSSSTNRQSKKAWC